MKPRHKATTKTIDALPMAQHHDEPSFARCNEWGLTDRQEAFAQGVANNLTLIDAYRGAYNTENSAVSTLYANASRLVDNPKVAARVRMLMAKRSERFEAFDVMRIRRHVFDRLMIESVDDDNPAAARLKAVELLGKIDVVSMFKEQKDRTPDQPATLAELEDKLKAAINRLPLINPSVPQATQAEDDERSEEDDNE